MSPTGGNQEAAEPRAKMNPLRGRRILATRTGVSPKIEAAVGGLLWELLSIEGREDERTDAEAEDA